MDVGTATDTGGWKFGSGPVVIGALFDVAPIVCEDCVFCLYFVKYANYANNLMLLCIS